MANTSKSWTRLAEHEAKVAASWESLGGEEAAKESREREVRARTKAAELAAKGR